MRGLRLFFGILLFVVTGCSSLPPTKIEAGHYTNPKYQMSFEVPSSPPWFQSASLPDRFIPKNDSWECTLGVFSDAIFVDDAHNGAIAVEAIKIWQDLGAVPPQRIEALIRKELEGSRHIRAAPFISDYEFKITAPYVCTVPLPLTHEYFTMKSRGTTYRCEIRTYVYTINEDDTCFLKFVLWSAPATYAQNRIALDNLVRSLQRMPSVPSKPPPNESVSQAAL